MTKIQISKLVWDGIDHFTLKEVEQMKGNTLSWKSWPLKTRSWRTWPWRTWPLKTWPLKMCFFLIVLMFCIYLPGLLDYSSYCSSVRRNETPVIGILTQHVSVPRPNRTGFIPASYVKFLESAGARVVPVRIGQTLEEYKRLFNSINGILWPGGSVSIISSDSQKASQIFYELAIEANNRGDYFPVWGTCLGFQQLMYLTSRTMKLSLTDTRGVSLPLSFSREIKASRMFRGFPAELMEDLASQPLTEHSHKWGLSVSTYNNNDKLKNFYRVLTTNTDGVTEFVSTVEAYDYPIYATQWHPEKNAFEWRNPVIPHSPSAIRTTFFMAEFFVNEARKNFHKFESEEEERRALIYNYSPVGTRPDSVYEYVYVL